MRRDWPLLGCVFLAAFVASRQLVVLLLAPPGGHHAHPHGHGHGPGPGPGHGHGAHQRCAPRVPGPAPRRPPCPRRRHAPGGSSGGAAAAGDPGGPGAADADRRRPPGGPHPEGTAASGGRPACASSLPSRSRGARLDSTRAEDPSAADGGGVD